MFKLPKSVHIIFAITLFGTSNLSMAQTNLNKYKYIVVPKKFEDFKKENQYQVNTLVKFLFTKKGFTTVWEDAMPLDLVSNQCSALFVNVKDDSKMFSTKTSVVLKDCNRQEVFVSKEGKSKAKDYKESYSEAITEAMTSFDTLHYKYEGDANKPITISFKNDVKKLKEPTQLKANSKVQNGVIKQEATTTKQTYKSVEPVDSNIKMAKNNTAVVNQIATPEEQFYKSQEPVASNIKMAQITKADSTTSQKLGTTVLYAQEIENGYQLVDSTPKILMKILKTSNPNYYLANGDAGKGVVYLEDETWYFERYEGENLIREELNIKF